MAEMSEISPADMVAEIEKKLENFELNRPNKLYLTQYLISSDLEHCIQFTQTGILVDLDKVMKSSIKHIIFLYKYIISL